MFMVVLVYVNCVLIVRLRVRVEVELYVEYALGEVQYVVHVFGFESFWFGLTETDGRFGL